MPVTIHIATLRRERILAGHNQQSFAKLVGISASYLSEIERGRYQPSPALLRRIADALNVDTRALVHRFEEAS